jgi:hypothetical protein
MYQLEVKKWLLFHKFPVQAGWEVTIDIDSMERGRHGQQKPDKQAVAAECEAWLRSNGVGILPHPVYRGADLVAFKEAEGTFIVEVEGDSSRQREQAMYSALGQIVLAMRNASSKITYGPAVPDDEKWAVQLEKVPSRIRELLRLELWLVSEIGIRRIQNIG